MKCEALNKLLHTVGERPHSEGAASEIRRIWNIMDSQRSPSGRCVALCRSLSLVFTLPVDGVLWNCAVEACKELLSLDFDKERVLDTVEDCLEHEPLTQVDAFLIQAFLSLATENAQSAGRWAEKARKLAASSGQATRTSWAEPICAISYYYRANNLKHQGKIKQAELALRKAVTLVPKLFLAWSNLGSVLIDQGKLSEALIACRKALEAFPQYWHAYQGIGNIYLAQEQLEKAEDAFRTALTLCPRNAQLISNLGFVQMLQGRLVHGVSTCKHAVSLDPTDCRLWNNLAVGLREVGRVNEGVTALRRAIECDPFDWRPSCNLILHRLKTGEISIAAEELRRYLTLQLRRAIVAPLLVAKDFSSFVTGTFPMRYDLLVQSDSEDKAPGCGKHIIDRYLLAVRQIVTEGFKSKELEPGEVIRDLLYVATLWCWCAEKLPPRGLSKDFVREQLYAIQQELVDSFPHETKAFGFASAWQELKARTKVTSPYEFAQEMIRQESAWLQSAGMRREQGEVEDLRWRLQGSLWVRLSEYQSEQQDEHLEQAHYFMELLKGHTVLHKLADPGITGTTTDTQKWNRYVESLPVQIDRTAVVDLDACIASLPRNGVALSFYFLDRDLIGNKLLAIVFKTDEEPYLKEVEGEDRREKLRIAAKRLKQVHHQVACREKVPKVGRFFSELSGEKEELRGRKLVRAVADWEKKQLCRAYEAILEGVIDVEELRDKDLYVSPSPEMYDIPFGLLLKGDEFLNSIVKSVTIVPIFSLRRFRCKSHFPSKDGLVLSLGQEWAAEAENRAKRLSGGWCSDILHQRIEHELSNFKGDVKAKYNEWIKAMGEMGKVHMIGHHDAWQWSHSTEERPNLGQFGRYLHEAPEKLLTDVLSLETCWGGTWAEPEDLMGLFVSFLASGVSHVIASPYSVVPAATSGKLFDRIYGYRLETQEANIGLQIACAIREAAEEVRLASLNSEDTIPTLWGALQLYGVA